MFDCFVYIDESGDLGKYGTSFFIVAALEVAEEVHLGRIVKKARKKMGKKLKEFNELKAVKTNPELRRFILNSIAKLDCKIFILAVEKKIVEPNLMREQSKLYNWVCGLFYKHITGSNVNLVIDKKYNNLFQRRELEEHLKIKFSQNNKKVSVKQLESQTSPQLQAVDFIAWAANRKFSHGDESYYKLIEGKIVNKGKEKLWDK